jgi:hypothetical protein
MENKIKSEQNSECKAVDQLESNTAEITGYLKSAILTNERYQNVTAFMDLFSDYTYVCMHTSVTSAETVKAKKAFKTHSYETIPCQRFHDTFLFYHQVAFPNSFTALLIIILKC